MNLIVAVIRILPEGEALEKSLLFQAAYFCSSLRLEGE